MRAFALYREFIDESLTDRMKIKHYLSLALAVAAFWPTGAAAQSLGEADLSTTAVRRSLAAAERTGSIQIDGRLDDAGWQGAPVGTGFIQAEPVEGVPADQETEVRVLFDSEAIYIGLRMFDESPSTIARALMRRDGGGIFDFVGVFLDTNLDRRTGYSFYVNPDNVQRDAYLFDDVRDDADWDAVWESGAQIDDEGWTAEMRIPLSQIRFQSSEGPQTWGINVFRRRVESNERSMFALESRRVHGRVSVMADLQGVRVPEGVRRLEVRPYLLARSHMGPADDGDPFFSGRDQGVNGGADLRFGLGSSFTLDATFNPDFGQVEVDPAVINLSANETIYPDRRPFFVEDARIFDFNLSGGSLFYSRRIGREPQRDSFSDADYVDVPAETPIIAAAKLTGRTNGGLSAGFLTALTGQQEGKAYFVTGDSLSAFVAEPRGEYAVGRLQQELRNGESVVGGIATILHRNLPEDGALDFLTSSAFTAGVDFDHTWANRAWSLNGFFAGSHIVGPETALIRIQRSSQHYFQRPDAYRLGVDSTATSMTGVEWRLQLDRRSGTHWTGSVWAAERTPGFDANDFGEFNGGERLDGGFRVNYQEIEPGDLFRDYRVSFNTFHNFRHEALRDPFSYDAWGDAHKRGSVNLNGNATFLNYWGLNGGFRYSPAKLDDELTRGGPKIAEPAFWNFDLRGNTDRREPLSIQPSFSFGGGGVDGRVWSTGVQFTWRPSTQVDLDVEPRYRYQPSTAQYVSTTADVGYAPTYGRRYLFADLDRRTFTLETRLNVTFTPDLSLQMFMQPLLSVGDYGTYKQLQAAETLDFIEFAEGTPQAVGDEIFCAGGRSCLFDGRRYLDLDGTGPTDYSFSERDFRVRSLRGNAVLRWEYRPGSTVFLVWQQRRSFRDLAATTFDVGGELVDLLGDQPDNVFIVKFNYWWSL